MELSNEKCVMVLDGTLPLGLVANTAAILGVTLGKHRPQAVGEDVVDQSGRSHLGIIEFPVPILRGTPELLQALRQKLYEPAYQDVTAADFSGLAQGCKTYEEFAGKMAGTPEQELRYLGLALCGPKKKVNALTGSLPLLR